MLTLVSTLVTVIVAFDTTEPLASLTSPVIVAVSCCASAKGEQSANSPKSNMDIDSLVFIFFTSMDTPSKAIGLDGEEIETVCELKGLSLRRAYGCLLWYIAPGQRHSPRKRERNGF